MPAESQTLHTFNIESVYDLRGEIEVRDYQSISMKMTEKLRERERKFVEKTSIHQSETD